jgi:hypothetical protein
VGDRGVNEESKEEAIAVIQANQGTIGERSVGFGHLG